MLNFLTSLGERTCQLLRRSQVFFWHYIQKESPYSGPYLGDIVQWHMYNFLLNNITTQTTFEGRERAEKKKAFIFIDAYCVLGW